MATVTVNPQKRKRVSKTKKPARKQPRMSFQKQIGAVASDSAPEKKNIDVSAAVTSVAATTWSLPTLLNQIAQGATANTRVGRRITIKEIMIRWHFDTGATTGVVGRWMLIYDHAPNGALPLITDIVTIDSINAPMNLINNDRFMVIHDELLNSENVLANRAIIGKFYRKFNPGLQNQWTNAATGTIADITTGAIYIACVGLASSTITFTSRIRFTDL